MTKSFVFFGLIRNNFDKEYVCKLYKNNGNTERDKILSLDSMVPFIALALTFDPNMKSYRLLVNNRSKNLYELNILTQEPAL